MAIAEIEPVVIGDRPVGPGHPVYVIAEAGVNHNGRVVRALEMCDAAKAAGADAVKFQAFRAAAFVSEEAPQAKYQEAHTRRSASQKTMLEALELSADDFGRIAAHCREVGIEFLASPFDVESVDMLVQTGVRAIKIASSELTDLPLLEASARARVPLIMSTGASQITEITEAVRRVHAEGAADIVLLHCLSVYPTPFEVQNLKAMQTLMELFKCVVGYSDHSKELLSGRLAVTVGASVLEKHFTLDRREDGPDHAMSVEPKGLAEYIRMARDMPADLIEIIRENERSRSAVGHGYKVPHSLERDVREVSWKSLAAAVDIPEGTVVRRTMLTTLRPGTGFPPAAVDEVDGAVASVDIAAGSILKQGMLGALGHTRIEEDDDS